MIQIRRNIFETNSSSSHSITMCTKDEYEDWKAGKLYLCMMSTYETTSKFAEKLFVTLDEVKDIIAKHKYNPGDLRIIDEDFIYDQGVAYQVFTHDMYVEYTSMEFYDAEYTTPKGETIVAFGHYGYDG